jgi:hypothetical protein
MAAKSSTHPTVSDRSPGTGGNSCPAVSRFRSLDDDTTGLYAAVRAAIVEAGGVDWLAEALDREPSYSSKVSEGVNRRDGRHAHVDWIAPLLDDPAAMAILLGWLCERAGFEAPRRRKTITREEFAAELLAEVDESGALGEALKERVARRLGVRVDQVKR